MSTLCYDEKESEVQQLFPSLFLAHGVPLTGLTDNEYIPFLRGLGLMLPEPKAIVIVTADEEGGAVTIGAADRFGGIKQEYGFPDELVHAVYPAKVDRELASDIGIMCSTHGIPYRFTVKRELDYRVYTILQALYPHADVPIVTMSVNGRLVPEEHYRIGRMLEPLRERDVLIIGCGSTGHRLRKLSWDAVVPERWQTRFDDWLTETIAVWHTEALFHYPEQAPFAEDAVLRGGETHLAPLFVALGTADSEKEAYKLHQSYVYGCLSLSAWSFGK